MALSHGSAHPLGATRLAQGVNFAVFSMHAERVVLVVWSAADTVREFDLPGRSGHVWHGLLPPTMAPPGTRYAYRVFGPFDPASGHRFDPEQLLVDPCTRDLHLPAPFAAAGSRRPVSRVIDASFDWEGDRPPAIPWRDTLVYELHVKGFTRRHPQLPDHLRGTYAGLGSAPVIEHLQSLHVTAVELLPVQAFMSEGFLSERGLSNYWGYNPLAWFAPAAQYALADPVREFKGMVKALHAAGIEVILDVVFNHTAEGNEAGPTLSLRGLDNAVYYRLLREDRRYYENLTGCGNTVNCAHPAVRRLIVDCLRYWVEEMHVDGFRFDLATVLAREDEGFNEKSVLFDELRAEPSLAFTKLIAEPWDVGLGGYQLGRFPMGWSEWNDRYRDQVRAFWNTDSGRIGDLAERMAGSSDIFRQRARKPTAGVNFITAHDGFTLRDLVSYNRRRNQANGENGLDGHSHNLSWNCGVEGETADAGVLQLRLRQSMNFLTTLLLSQGVPMLQAGDEFGRTQQGNNNAWCQDNEISWVDWSLVRTNAMLLDFTWELVRIRRSLGVYQREVFLKGAGQGGVKDVSWLRADGGEMVEADWRDPGVRAMGMEFRMTQGSDVHVLLLVNARRDVLQFSLPRIDAGWRPRFDTALAARGEHTPRNHIQDTYRMEPLSMVMLEV